MANSKNATIDGEDEVDKEIRLSNVQNDADGVRDYHLFTTIDTPKEERERLHVGDIYINAATCGECKERVRSRNKHDFRTCKCGGVSVDGGSFYARRAFKSPTFYGGFVDEVVPYNDVSHGDIDT